MVFQASPTPDDQSPEQYNQALERHLAPESSLTDSMNARFDLGLAATPTFRAASMLYAKAQARSDEPLLSPKELNEKYPNVEVPFNEHLPDSVAQFISHQQEIKARMADTIERGPQTKLLAPLNFAAGVAPALMDPAFIAAGMATGGLAEAGGILHAAEGAGMLEAGLKGAGHAAISMAAPEAASGVLAGQQQENYSLSDYAENVGSAALLSGGLHALPPAVRFLKSTLRGKPDQVAQSSAISQLVMGKKVNVDPIVNQMTGEMNGAPPINPEFQSSVSPYEYRPIDTSAPVSGKFYHASEGSLGDLNTAEHSPLEHELGAGVYLTDNPNVANGVAARGMADAPGRIHEVSLENAKLLDLEQPLPEDLRSALPESDPAQPAKQVLQNLSPDELEAFGQAAQKAGYDGYRHEGGKFLGSENDPHNIVKLFDPESEKLKQTGDLAPSAEVTHQPGQAELQALSDHQQSHASDRLFDQTEHDELQHAMNHPAEETELNHAQVQHAEEMETLKQVVDQGHLEAAAKAEYEKLEEEMKAAPEKESAFKSYMNCLIGAFGG